MTEQLSYRVVAKLPHAEIRRYPPHLLISTFESGRMPESGNQAFRRLANYIFGGNQQSKSIAMTAPVLQQPNHHGYETSFVMPASMTLEDMPGTSDSSLRIQQATGGLYAAITFSGLASGELFEKKTKELKEIIKAADYRESGAAVFARYNGPWTPFFLRRNEVLIPLEE